MQKPNETAAFIGLFFRGWRPVLVDETTNQKPLLSGNVPRSSAAWGEGGGGGGGAGTIGAGVIALLIIDRVRLFCGILGQRQCCVGGVKSCVERIGYVRCSMLERVSMWKYNITGAFGSISGVDRDRPDDIGVK